MGNKLAQALKNVEKFCVGEIVFGHWKQITALVLEGDANDDFERMRKQDRYARYKVIPEREIGMKV